MVLLQVLVALMCMIVLTGDVAAQMMTGGRTPQERGMYQRNSRMPQGQRTMSQQRGNNPGGTMGGQWGK